MPPTSDRNRPPPAAGWPVGRNARSTLPRRASASTNRGNSDFIDRVSMSPAWMPPRSGSAMRPTVSRAEAPAEKRSNRFVVVTTPRERHAREPACARAGRRQQVVRCNSRAASSAHPAQTGRAVDRAVRACSTNAVRGGVVAISLAVESQCLAQLERRGFLRKHGFGTGFDDEAVDVIGANQAAGARGGFEQPGRECRAWTARTRPKDP